MKKHFFQFFLFLVGMTLFSSCMKDDPENNQTVYYGHQQIPNINEYKPQSLLRAMFVPALVMQGIMRQQMSKELRRIFA